MEEIWKDIKFIENDIEYDYSNKYRISNFGRIKYLNKKAGFSTRKEKVSFGYPDKDGYLRVYLCKNSKIKTIGIHRLVALMFISNPNNLPQVNHKDEDKTNNRVDNLEWCTCRYNINYGTRTQKSTFTRKMNLKRAKN